MPRLLRVLFTVCILLVIVGAPLAYQHHRETRFRNFHVVREGVLYRSGQLSIMGLRHIIHDHRIKTVITLRDAYTAGKEPPDKAEEIYCETHGYRYVRIPPRSWQPGAGGIAAEKSVQTFREVMSNPANHPVLIHCFAGIHRTGALCAIYRMEYEGWSNDEAIAEMRNLGYHLEHADVLGFLKNYRHTHAVTATENCELP